MSFLENILNSTTTLAGKYIDSRAPRPITAPADAPKAETPKWVMPAIIGSAALLVVLLVVKR